ncbi:MAG: hypothetical protein EXR81_00230 [Gammaproteobacteria bacterium]|nr:hypothetical protein [Gammaproteobacteria bacterium]
MNKLLILLIALATLLLASCASNPFSSYKSTSDQRLEKIYAGDPKSAMSAKETPDILYNMEYGMLLRLDQQYPPSNIYFGRAQQVMDIWANSWLSTTSGELSLAATSMLLNDNANAYQPRGYEKSFLATYYALNFVDLNSFDNARVEIKKMYELEQATQNYNQVLYNQTKIESEKQSHDRAANYLHQQILQKYDFSDINSSKVLALKNSYQNAFSHYLAGFVFEALNEPSLSRPGYMKAGQLSPTNSLIQKSIDNLDNGMHPKPSTSDLLLVEEVGHAPQIESQQVTIFLNMNFIDPKKNCVNTINIFFPKLIPDQNNDAIYSYQLDDQQLTPVPMADVNLMAARALKDETPHLIARNIAAALRNVTAAQLSCSSSNDQLGMILNIGAAITGILLDKADERILTLLPSKININRLNLPYGQHTVTVRVNGQTYTQQITLNQPYQILAFRIMGNQVFFNTQQSMVTK